VPRAEEPKEVAAPKEQPKEQPKEAAPVQTPAAPAAAVAQVASPEPPRPAVAEPPPALDIMQEEVHAPRPARVPQQQQKKRAQ
jgi:hypothetical protein